MHLVIETQSAVFGKRQVLLLPSQILVVGRSALADFAVPDMAMAERHFEVECTISTCRIRNLNSSGGTRVNGSVISEATLDDGDIIEAGQTRFHVHVEDGIAPEQACQAESERATEPAAPVIVAASRKTLPPAVERLTLRVVAGPGESRSTWLLPGQSLSVGRCGADFSISGDRTMSRVHFRITRHRERCLLEDCGSKQGTYLNGKRIQTAVLREGDRIRAGQTTFAVHVEGGVVVRRSSLDLEREAAAALCVRYEMEMLGTGMAVFFDPQSRTRPAEVIHRLEAALPLFLIADFDKLNRPLPDDLTEPQFIFPGFPAEIAIVKSPVLIAPGDTRAFYELIEQGWDMDALVCVFAQLARPDLTRHLRDAAGGYLSPRAVAVLFEHGIDEEVATAAEGIKAWLIPADSPGDWDLYAPPTLASLLDGHGFAREHAHPQWGDGQRA